MSHQPYLTKSLNLNAFLSVLVTERKAFFVHTYIDCSTSETSQAHTPTVNTAVIGIRKIETYDASSYV